MPKARLYFDGDNSGIEKEARIYSLTQEVEDKLDSISNFQDEIDDLQDQINNLASRGRYLSTWNAVTGLPETNPQVDPYVYRAGDYYIVSVVGGTNYRPTGSEYHVGVASQVVESQSVSQNDLYIYDGIQWVLQGSGSSLLAVWGSITGTLSAQTDLQNALDAKANKTDVLEKTNTTSYTPTADYHPATKKYVDDNISAIDVGDKIVYATQAEYNALLPGALTDNKHYFIYSTSGGGGWQPGVNTIAYYELNGDVTDATGNYDGTASNVIYTTLASGIEVATFNGSSSKIEIASPLVNNLSTFTVNVWINDTANNFGNVLDNQSNVNNGMFMDSIDGTQFRVGLGGGSTSNSSLTLNTWHNVVLVYNNGTYTVYFDNQQDYTENSTYSNGINMTIGAWVAQNRYWTGYISKVIFENKAWAVEEISDYYDQTKGDYGIS